MTRAPLDRFAALDRLIADRRISRRTLDPSREAALGFVEIAEVLDLSRHDARLVDALASLATELVNAVAEHFPENVFGDYAALVEACLLAAEGADEPVHTLEETARVLVDLQALFGCTSTVRFRYVHDFLYGYDWAKWVQRDPASRASIGPYAMPFLKHMHQRGRELLELIAVNDRTYPQLRDAKPRNPFRFDREPASEIAIHQALALRDELPVRAYRLRAVGEPCGASDRPYQELRVAVAGTLGLVTS